MVLLYILIIVGVSSLAVGFFILKGRDSETERLGCTFAIIGFACLVIAFVGYFSYCIIDMIHNTAS